MRRATETRGRTDRIVSTLWILVPLGGLALSYTTLIIFILTIEKMLASITVNPNGTVTPATPIPTSFVGFSYVELASFVLLIAELYLFYVLIKRRNLHFEREYRFFYDTSFVLKALVAQRGLSLNQNVQGYLRDIDSNLTMIHNKERERSAVLWIILLFIPIVNIFAFFYVYYFLMNDFVGHESMEDWMLGSISRVLAALGINYSFSRESAAGEIPQRSFWLYLVLDIVTLGVFGVYWMYTLIKDPNKHFTNQVQIESSILSAVTT